MQVCDICYVANPVIVKLELLERQAVVESLEALNQVLAQTKVLENRNKEWLGHMVVECLGEC